MRVALSAGNCLVQLPVALSSCTTCDAACRRGRWKAGSGRREVEGGKWKAGSGRREVEVEVEGGTVPQTRRPAFVGTRKSMTLLLTYDDYLYPPFSPS